MIPATIILASIIAFAATGMGAFFGLLPLGVALGYMLVSLLVVTVAAAE